MCSPSLSCFFCLLVGLVFHLSPHVHVEVDSHLGWKVSRKLWWHYWFNGQEFEQTRADSEGQGSRVYCSPWGHRVGHHRETEQQLAFGGAHLYQFLHPLCISPPHHPVSSFSFVTSGGLGLLLSRPCFMDLSPPRHCFYSKSTVCLLFTLCLSWKSLFGLPRVSDSSASHMWDYLGSSDKLHEVKGKGEAPLSPLGLGWRLNKSQTFLRVSASSSLGACSSQLRVAYEFYHPDVESQDEG